MKKILVISQKILVQNPVFKQDKNLKEMIDNLKQDNKIDLLYLHKEIKSESEPENTADTGYLKDIRLFNIRDMMKKNLFKINIVDFIKKGEYEVIIFSSYYMAKLVLPYIENIIKEISVTVDFRLSPISYVLYQYNEENEKKFKNLSQIMKDFKIKFLQTIAVLQQTDYAVFDSNANLDLLKAEKINNIIAAEDIAKEFKVNRKNAKMSVSRVSVNSNNFSVKPNLPQTNTGVVELSKYENTADKLNNAVLKSDSDLIFFHSAKLAVLPDIVTMMAKHFSFNDKIALVSPLLVNAPNNTRLQLQDIFDNQRNNNFANWEESAPALFPESFMLKKSVMKKIGYFDNKFNTVEYSVFDFLMRLYKNKYYYFVAKDVMVFKSVAAKQQTQLLKEDKKYLCFKWGESISNFQMEA